ncbi:osmotically inducible protein C [Bacillus canaveralius]|uniref:Osmotically inducible protein C n=1 Tax=Bacillus canaveralius TaxID=1403243 RepID=A0A2N5GJH4_9BACI|nr:OsmC family protein [Bacillus canaveralius]PLR81340.1 osmotically inducible protein C [Bacillus canaveralius]PLR94904.1 osmotically inducible protein C [Bacillus canaveralius]RSK53648.1 OsmC family peroxiredoxin [Bacillus canaveralius]
MEFKMKESGFYSEFAFGRLDVSGNEQHGFRPFQLMVSALAVCSGGVLRSVLEKMRIEVYDITIDADVRRNEQEANKIEAVHLHFRISGKDLIAEKIEKAMKLTEKNCPMVQSVKGSIQINETFEIIDNH